MSRIDWVNGVPLAYDDDGMPDAWRTEVEMQKLFPPPSVRSRVIWPMDEDGKRLRTSGHQLALDASAPFVAGSSWLT